MLERYEKQFAASAEAQTGSQTSFKKPLHEKGQTKKPFGDHHVNVSSLRRGLILLLLPVDILDATTAKSLVISDEIAQRHLVGCSKSSAGTNRASSKAGLNELSESPLEALLTEKRRQREEASLPTDSAQTSLVTASGEEAEVVVPVVMMSADINGIPVSANNTENTAQHREH